MNILRPENMDRFKPYQRAEAAQLMWDILRDPEVSYTNQPYIHVAQSRTVQDFYYHIKRYTSSFSLGTIYGCRAPQFRTGVAEKFTKVQSDFMYALELGKMPPVDLFPLLKAVPARWAKWKGKVMDIRQRQEALFGGLLEQVRHRVSHGMNNGAFMEEAIEMRKEWGLNDVMLL
jgi:hypothetical protein